MNSLKRFWDNPVVRSVGIVGGVILIFFLVLILTLPRTQIDDGSEATPTSSETEESSDLAPTEDSGDDQTDREAVEAVADAPDTEFSRARTLRDWGIGNLTIKGLYASDSFWIPLPTNWFVESLWVNLHYSPSPLLNEGRANLNVSVNGHNITSIDLAGEGEQVVSFRIPVEYIDQGDGFSFSFKGYLRLTDIYCEEGDNPGQWVTILDTTEIIINANPTDIPPLLENMRLLMGDQEEGDQTIFVMPDSPDSTILSAAAAVAARLGFVDGTEPPKVVTTSSISSADLENSNLVLVGLADDLPLMAELASTLPAPLEEGSFLTLDGTPAPHEHGVVQILRSPWNIYHSILVVSAGNEAGLLLAQNAFTSRELFDTLTGSFQFIKQEYELVNSFTSTPWLFTPATLADFDYEKNRELGGLGTSSATYYLRWPPGWTVAPGSEFNLSLIISPVVETNSHAVVLINGEIVGVSPIDPGVPFQSFTFSLPSGTINQNITDSRLRNMQLQVRMISIMETDECKYTDEVTAWVQVESDSYFTMLHSYRASANLQTYPYPLVNDQPMQPIVIVLPDNPSRREIAAGLAVSKQLGDYILDDFEISLLTASQLNQQEHSDAHIIPLGTLDRQPWLEDFRRTLPIVPDDGVYQDLEDENIGLIMEGASPWNAGRTILLILSVSNPGLEQGIEKLLELNELEESTAWMEYEIK